MMDYTATDGLAAGDAAYMRVRVIGFVSEGSNRIAVVEPIERNGKPCDCLGARSVYYCPVPHLVAATVIAKESKGQQ